MTYDVIIIGAGAAGLFAAANLPKDKNCLVLEQRSTPGKKLLLSGSGQCNITHGGNMRDFLVHYGAHGKIIRPILYQYGNQAVIDFFRGKGIRLIERNDGKVFPETLKSSDILKALVKACDNNRVSFAFNAPVTDIQHVVNPDSGKYFFNVVGGNVIHKAKRIIVATGGKSYPKTGSDGSIMPILKRLGQPLIPQTPALTPILTQNYRYSHLSGISFRDIWVYLSGKSKNGISIRKRGDLLLTHKGFSGPVILELSRYAHQGDTLKICYLPGMDVGALSKSIMTASNGSQKQFISIVAEIYGDMIPTRLIEALCKVAGINPFVKASSVAGKSIKHFSTLLLGDTHTISSIGGFNVAMVTAGGVDLGGVDLKTLQSKICTGVYFAGEVLDVDGDTGGYNLQFAFSSGVLASRLL